MIIQRLRLHPFAGVADREVCFQPGLNVVAGPNEAGKSTLVNALWLCLFQPTSYYKRDWKETISCHVPVGGGDTIQVELGFSAAGQGWTLRRSWGGTDSSELQGGGKLITDDEAVDEQLQELLVRTPGTYENVLIAPQAYLPESLSQLSEDGEQTERLANLLRKAAFETDGVSIASLGGAIEEQLQAIYGRWDLDAGRPEKGRGIENPWQKSVGELLQAWYAKETVKRDLAASREHEQRMDALNAEIGRLEAEAEALRAFVEQNKAVVEAAQRHHVLSAERQALHLGYKELAQVNQGWPVLEEQLKQHRKDHEAFGQRVEALAAELEQAEAYNQSKALVERFDRASKKQQQIAAASSALEENRSIDPAKLDELVEQDRTVDEARISLQAGLMTFELRAEAPLALRLQRDLEPEQERELAIGESLEVQAGGRLALQHTEWSLTARSGEVDFEELQRRHQAAKERAHALLSELGCDDLAAARQAAEAEKERRKELAGLRRDLEELLDGESYEALEARVNEVGELEKPRQTSAVVAALTDAKSGRDTAKGKLSQGEEQIEAWVEAYGAKESVLDALVEKKAELGAKEKELEELAPLLAGAEDPEALIQAFDDKQRALTEVTDTLGEQKIERAGLKAPEQTLEELVEAQAEANAAFARKEARGQALQRVQEVFDEARQELDSGTMQPWLEDLRQVVAPLTEGRYQTVRLEEGGVACRPDELELPYELLSQGTRSCLGLALRLSMARRFLQGIEGFVVLDDPLVDLDPARQQAACELLRGFAADKQVIVLTCHPQHEQLLQGHTIELGREG